MPASMFFQATFQAAFHASAFRVAAARSPAGDEHRRRVIKMPMTRHVLAAD
jgi:hypothetical protein